MVNGKSVEPCSTGQPRAAVPRWSVPIEHERGRSRLHSGPAQCVLAVGECPHLHRFAIAECKDIGEADVLPDIAVVGSDPGVHENDDSVARWNESFRFAVHVCHGRTRLSQIGLRSCLAVVGPASGKFSRFNPFDLRVKRLRGSRDVSSIESGVGVAQSADGLLLLLCGLHASPFAATPMARSGQAQSCNGHYGWKFPHTEPRTSARAYILIARGLGAALAQRVWGRAG